MKLNILLISAFLIFDFALALTCAADNLAKPGICINQTYTYFGRQIYMSCYFNPYYTSGSLWQGYTQCYATIRTGNLTSDKGSVIVEAWTADSTKLNLCANYNGYGCDVSTSDGYTLSETASDRGVCDGSDANCVKCSSNHVENKSWTGSSWITGEGDGLCESGCGSEEICDEVGTNAWSNKRIGSTQFEAYCGSACTTTDQRCRSAYGSHFLCELLKPGDVCSVDFCTNANTLMDYNEDHLLNNVSCTSSCGCDTSYLLLCDTECGASNECNNQEIGYNTINAGCNHTCVWNDCGLYKWNNETISCRTSCSINNECYSNAICDLVGVGNSTCINDSSAPTVTILSPTGTPHYNSSITVTYSVDDNADPLPYCNYVIDTTSPIFLDYVTLGTHNFTINVNQNFHNITVNCIDDSSNQGNSSKESFLYDTTAPSYDAISYTDLTSTVDGSLMNGDNVMLSVHWTDNFILDTAVLEVNREGAWQSEQSIGFINGWSNFTINSSCTGDKNILWRVTGKDTAGNMLTTSEQTFYVYNPSTYFTITQHTSDSLMPSFTGWASIELNKKPDNSINDSFIGEFTLEHAGRGTRTKYSFKLKDALPDGIIIKLSNNAVPSDEITLAKANQHPSWCQDNIRGSTCQVWMWMSLDNGNDPQTILDNIIILSEDIT